MIEIGKSYCISENGISKLCSDININGVRRTLWFGVDERYGQCLSVGRADPFLVILLPSAMILGDETIVCEDVISSRLFLGINEYLLPTLVRKSGKFKKVTIKGNTSSGNESWENNKAVGVGFSGGVDSLFSILSHGKDSSFPVTHLAVFNSGVFEGDIEKNFCEACARCQRFADMLSLETVFVNSNIPYVLRERFLDIYSFRNLGFALALQGLFSTYLLSSGHDAAHFSIDFDNSATYDMLTVNSVCTENLTFYLSGAETTRVEKIKSLAEWQPAYSWLHPCIKGFAGGKNCGKCKKCIRDMTTLYCLGKLDAFNRVFDIEEFTRNRSQKMAFVMANKGNHLFDDVIFLMEQHPDLIPEFAYRLASSFKASIDQLKADISDDRL